MHAPNRLLVLLAFSTGLLSGCGGEVDPSAAGSGLASGAGETGGTDPKAGSSAPASPASPASPAAGTAGSCHDVPIDGPWRACIASSGLVQQYQTPMLRTERGAPGVHFTGVHNNGDVSANFSLALGDWSFADAPASRTFQLVPLESVWGTYPAPGRDGVTLRLYESRFDLPPEEDTIHWAAVRGTVSCEPAVHGTRILCRFHDIACVDSPSDGPSTRTATVSGWVLGDVPR